MQPAQFQCGHCGKLMAVSSEHLGQQVLCPHCQQVVIAPPPGSVLPPPALPNAAENIFSPTDVGSDLFGRSEAPHMEMPPESLPPTLPSDGAVPPHEPQAPPAPSRPETQQPAVEPPAPLAPFAHSENAAVQPAGDPPPWLGSALPSTLPPPSAPAPIDSPFIHTTLERDKGVNIAASAYAHRQSEAKAPWFLLLVFCPLLLYSIVISIFAFFIYQHDQQLQEQFRERFDKMPDVGDDPGVRRGKKVNLTDRYKPELATLPLPDSLCTTLGKPLCIGDLQVTPNRIERKRMSVIVESSRPEPCRNDSLVLYLDLKNLSADYAFAPLDNYFDRYWRPGLDLIPPLTLLEIGDKYRCYGGPAHWHPRSDRANLREWIKGRQNQANLLQPGEEKQMFVCTDGDDARAAAVLFGDQPGDEYHGPFLWRVRLRRGLVRFGDKDCSVTAVIGVRFTDVDVSEAAPEAQ